MIVFDGTAMENTFFELLDILRDESQPIPTQRINEFSDLDRDQIQEFVSTWTTISTQRKQQILQIMGQRAYDHIELSFEAINRIAIQDPASEVRSIAIENLWESEDPSLVPILLESLGYTGDEQIRAVAATALGKFVWLGEIEKIPTEFLSQVETSLLDACKNDVSIVVRRRSLESIGYSSHDQASQQIEDAYNTNDEGIQQSAIIAMGRSANERWDTYVLNELINPDPLIRLEATRAAGELEIREALDLLIDLLQDVNDDIRLATIWALAEIGGDAALNALVELSDNSEDNALQDVIQEAIDHLTFMEGSRNLLLFDFDEDQDSKAPES